MPDGPDPDQFCALNDFVTVVWRDADDGKGDYAGRVGDLLHQIARFMKRRGAPLVWAYCRENGPVTGDHLHLAIYVRDGLRDEFRGKVRSWVRARAVGKVKPGAVRFVPVTDRAGGITGLIQYMLKEGDDTVRARFEIPDDIPKFARKGGSVLGKRVSVSASISERARLAAKPDHYEHAGELALAA
jgi:hypothetical protein